MTLVKQVRTLVVLVGAAAASMRAHKFWRANRKLGELRARQAAAEDLAQAQRNAGLSPEDIDLFAALQTDGRFSPESAHQAFAQLRHKEAA